MGALSFLLFWILAFTGLYLFIFFETSITGAHASVETITNEQYYIGSIMRSLHRYASAAMAVSVTVHLIKELFMRRMHGPRLFSWISGVPLLWLLFAAGIGGYWLVWDERAQYIATATARLFDALPVVVEPMAFGFVSDAAVNDRFFTLLIFLHVGIPLALLLGMFIHIQRISDARSFPDRPVTALVIGALVVLSLVKPATSMPPADLDRTLHVVEIDWFYMNFYPLIDAFPAGLTWVLLLGITVVLVLMPLFVPKRKHAIAVVDPEYCNGCGWCFADCPYDAVTMKPHDFREGHRQSVVATDRCVGCGICAGACPTSTPFKSVNRAFSGINLDDLSNAQILIDTEEQLATMPESGRLLVVGCAHGPDLSRVESDNVSTLRIECIAQLPPSYLDYLCRREHLDRVVLTGCSTGNCYHRIGNELQEARLAHEREPHLRFKDVRVKVTTIWSGPAGTDELVDLVRNLELETADDLAETDAG